MTLLSVRRVALPRGIRFLAQGFLLVAVSFTSDMSLVSGQAVTQESFLARYRQQLGELESTYRTIQIDGKYRHHWNVGSTSGQPNAGKDIVDPLAGRPWLGFQFRVTEESLKLSLLLHSGDRYGERVNMKVGTHLYSLHRSAPNGDYELTESASIPETQSDLMSSPTHLREAPFCPWGYFDFPSRVNAPDFKVVEVTGLDTLSRGPVKLTFRYETDVEPRRKVNGWVSLDTAANWVLTEYDLHSVVTPPGKGEIVTHTNGSVHYSQSEGTPIPTDATFRKELQSREARQVEAGEYQVERCSLKSTPAEEFTLAYYGLGDFEQPATAARSSNRFGYLALAVAVAAGLASLVLARQVRAERRKRAEVAASMKSV